jgi:hypothetical protein
LYPQKAELPQVRRTTPAWLLCLAPCDHGSAYLPTAAKATQLASFAKLPHQIQAILL